MVKKENPNWNKRANKKVLCAESLYELIVKFNIENSKQEQEIAQLNGKVLSWKTAWFEQRDISGKAAWQMPPEGYGRPSNEVNTMHIFDFKLEQPCSAEETKTRIAKAKEVRKEYMTPVAEKKPRVFGSSTQSIKILEENIPIDLFETGPQASGATGKPVIKYDAWTTYLDTLRQK